MSTSRLFNLFVALALVVVTALTIHAGIATSQAVSTNPAAPAKNLDRGPELWGQDASQPSRAAALDPHERNPKLIEYREQQRAAGNRLGTLLDHQTRDAIQARWLAQHGGTNRTCVLLCGGW
jgi:hypothetical protein